MAYTKEVSNKLNELLEKNYDAEAGYKAAAGNVKNSKLKTYFQNKAEDRYAFGHELKEEIKLHGDAPENETSFKGDAHRTWMNLKSTFSGNKEEAILEETIKGEKAFAEDYDDVLKETTLAVSTKKLIENQRNKVRNSLEEVKTMESFA
ncbi:ferritin-like domain-containing protein [Psychroflexus montanilacus]|uniref:ferritin-like domain-containing protein n=1 Tax=Psychroflexus montanilacus TaxID=2873598 RepID=UPI001CCFF48F|nr:PA2169 family four-helix-bundle protein [Psychroflexus montanilacus]MBZ9652521.1 PA2169 family four-helix-bundle protein [Psychroflexus montanilacus]